jgi:hypothetical protein
MKPPLAGRVCGLVSGLGLLVLGACSSLLTNAVKPAAAPPVAAQALLDTARTLPDYSYAGYGFGVASIPEDQGRIIRAAEHGVMADDGKDDTQALLKAVAAAASVPGRVTVLLPPGRIQISDIIPIERSDFILKGAGQGPGGTELFFPRPLKVADTSNRQDELRAYLKREDKYQREPDLGINLLFTEYSWSGGFLLVGAKGSRPASYDPARDRRDPVITQGVEGRQFERKLSVRSVDGLKPGQVVQLQWFSVDGPDSEILKSLYGDLSVWNSAQAEDALKMKIGSHHWTFTNRPVVAQATRIVRIDGNVVTLGDPLLHSISAAQPAVLADWQHLSNVGIEDMDLTFPMSPFFGHHLEQGYNGIYMTGVFDGWIRNMTITNADSGVLTDNAASLTISNLTTTGEHKAHYSVHVGAVHNVLVKDLRVENPVVHPLSVNTRSTRSVYLRAFVARDGIIDQHSGSNHQNLFDQVTLTGRPVRAADGRWIYPLWVGGGAGYWKPGHGLHNTHWNVRLNFEGVPRGADVEVKSGLEGPGARIVGLSANRTVEVSYKPTAQIESTGGVPSSLSSLYEYQLMQRTR